MASRTIDIVLVTEAPVTTFDVSRSSFVEEVLVISGCDFPSKVPLLDTHKRDSVRSVLGSIRNLHRATTGDGPAVKGRAHFSEHPAAVGAYTNYAGGHLTDFSVGALRLEIEYRGEVRYVTRNRIREGSTVIQGADSGAKSVTSLSASQRAMIQQPKTALQQLSLLSWMMRRGWHDLWRLPDVQHNIQRETAIHPGQSDVEHRYAACSRHEAGELIGSAHSIADAVQLSESDRRRWLRYVVQTGTVDIGVNFAALPKHEWEQAMGIGVQRILERHTDDDDGGPRHGPVSM